MYVYLLIEHLIANLYSQSERIFENEYIKNSQPELHGRSSEKRVISVIPWKHNPRSYGTLAEKYALQKNKT